MLSDDINRVAKTICNKQLTKINKSMKIDQLPGGGQDLKRIPSEEDLFEIPGLDNKNELDLRVINYVQSLGEGGGSSYFKQIGSNIGNPNDRNGNNTN